MRTILFMLMLCFSFKAFSHPIDIKYISPEKRYEMEKQIFEVQRQHGKQPDLLEFPEFFLWQQLEYGREKRFYDWIKTFLLFLDGALSCEMSYYVWADQNPVKVK